MDNFKLTGLTDHSKQAYGNPTFGLNTLKQKKPELRVRFQEDNNSECSSRSEDESSDGEYQQKLQKYRKMGGLVTNQRDEEDEQPNIMKSKHIEPILKNKSVCIKKTSQILTKSTVLTQANSRPRTSHSSKTKVMKKKANDPVSRYQELSTTWRKDSFLSKGANKKEGRKLLLSERNRIFGLLY